MGNIKIFMCTNSEQELTMVFTCFREKPKVLQYARADQNTEISRIPGISTCCKLSCCHSSPLPEYSSPTEDDQQLLDTEPQSDDITTMFYEQASFWVLFMVLLLVLIIVGRGVYYSFKPNRVLELLRRMSTGPLSQTREGKEGNIEPVLFYYEPSQRETGDQYENKDGFKYKTKKAKRWFSHKMRDNVVYEIHDEKKIAPASGEQSEQILDAKRLLARQLERLERSCYQTNTLNRPSGPGTVHSTELELELFSQGCDGHCQTQPRTQTASRRPSGSYSLSIEIPGPLKPSYQPSLVVNNVWNTDINMQRLYRYTTMQGMIYPPGYVP